MQRPTEISYIILFYVLCALYYITNFIKKKFLLSCVILVVMIFSYSYLDNYKKELEEQKKQDKYLPISMDTYVSKVCVEKIINGKKTTCPEMSFDTYTLMNRYEDPKLSLYEGVYIISGYHFSASDVISLKKEIEVFEVNNVLSITEYSLKNGDLVKVYNNPKRF